MRERISGRSALFQLYADDDPYINFRRPWRRPIRSMNRSFYRREHFTSLDGFELDI